MSNINLFEKNILFQDNHLIIINKKPGELTQGDKTNDKTLGEKVKYYLKEKYNKPGNVYLGITHRLDRPTSGIIIFTKTSKSLTRLNKMFKENSIKKTYWAVVNKISEKKEIKLEDFLLKNSKQNKSYVKNEKNIKAKKSILYYKQIHTLNKYSLLEIRLETGRHHQIRTQLSNKGMAIKGDLKYGFPRSNKDGSIHLHSRKIEFQHPISKNIITITANPPKNIILDLCIN